MAAWRRITRGESYADWKARAYTRVKAGEYRAGKSSRISRRQYQEKATGGVSLEKAAEKRKTAGTRSISADKAVMTRKANRELSEEGFEKLPKKYSELLSTTEGDRTEEQMNKISEMYRRYPRHLVDAWFYNGGKRRKAA